MFVHASLPVDLFLLFAKCIWYEYGLALCMK